jgi:hypothetical protein
MGETYNNRKDMKSFERALQKKGQTLGTCLFAFFTPRPHEDGSIVSNRSTRRDSVAIDRICQLPDNHYDGRSVVNEATDVRCHLDVCLIRKMIFLNLKWKDGTGD